ncbi:MAG TPA: site-2 protease family protein [Dongiaceae bacterium]|nr:site-2 protease family protein [Dongiaceae bacterium]
MATYYKTDSRKITLREYWNILPSPKVLFPWLAGRLGIAMDLGSSFCLPDSVREWEIAPEALLPPVWASLHPVLEQALQLGCHSPRYHSFENLRRDTRTSSITLLHESGEFAVRLMHAYCVKAHPPTQTRLLVLLSELEDGTYFFTTNQKPTFNTPPGVTGQRLIGADLPKLVAAHQQALERMRTQNPPRSITTLEALDDLTDRYEKYCNDFKVRRGLHVAMTPEEVAAEQHIQTDVAAMSPGNAEHAAVLTELSVLQNKKTGWGSAVMILLVSLVLFVGAGARQWSGEYLIILMGVLFVHELGHYLAMRAFNYRNLRMFFIPFFGAAVSGRHFNVAGWKKVIVSLMGPVPGIVLGIGIGLAGMTIHQPLLIKIGLVSLFLNGFNLLPVLPFDGGWVFHNLLFTRHYLLDTIFRVVAAIALLGANAFFTSKIFLFLGIAMLVGIPFAYRMARIADRLREQGVPPAPPDAPGIPAETAQAIIGEIKRSLPQARTNKQIAEHTLQIFETLNARPPGWAASIGLLAVHGASIGLAIMFSLVFMAARNPDAFRFGLNGARATHPVRCGEALTWSGPESAGALTNSQNTVIATLSPGTLPAGVFQSLTNRLPATARLQTFGPSLLLVLPVDLEGTSVTWRNELARTTRHVFVDRPDYPTAVNITCVAPNEAAAAKITAELDEYFNTLPQQFLVPPWLPQDTRSAAERAQHQLARRTYMLLSQAQYKNLDTAEMKSLQDRLATATHQRHRAEADTLKGQIGQLSEQIQKQNLDAIRNGKSGTVDTNLADLYLQSQLPASSTNGAYETLIHQMAQRMGQVPLVAGRAAPEAERYLLRNGKVNRHQTKLQLLYLTFEHVADGAPAVADWLCDQGCTGIKYGFQPGAGMPDLDED